MTLRANTPAPPAPVLPAKTGSRGRTGLPPSLAKREEVSAPAGRGASIPTYYDQPALKPSLYGWKVSTYMWVGGIAGSAQVIAAAAQLADREGYAGTIRRGRYIALAGAALGAPLLIADLHTPQRFYNMLRIFRPTSPMSIGSYVLTAFGGLSAFLAAAQLRRDLGAPRGALDRAAAVVQLPAAAAGAAMSTYTGALLTATSTPLWAAAPRLIPSLFGASAMAAAAAALSLAARGNASPALHRIELLGSGVELCLLAALPARLRDEGIETRAGAVPLLALAAAPLVRRGIAAIAPPAAPGSRREGRGVAAASVAVLAGAFLLRHLLLRAGNRSATRPRDHFRFTRPR